MCPPVRTCFFRCLFPFISISSNHWFVVSVCKGKGISSNLYRFGVWWQLVAASGREWLRSPHVFKGLNALPLHPSGRAKPKARTAGPGSVLLLGSKKVSGYRCLAESVTTGISPIRSQDTARCPLSNSKGFGLLPKRPCPSRGGLPLRSREACFHLRCGCFCHAYAVTPLNPM